jgi:hypothetical protein
MGNPVWSCILRMTYHTGNVGTQHQDESLIEVRENFSLINLESILLLFIRVVASSSVKLLQINIVATKLAFSQRTCCN